MAKALSGRRALNIESTMMKMGAVSAGTAITNAVNIMRLTHTARAILLVKGGMAIEAKGRTTVIDPHLATTILPTPLCKAIVGRITDSTNRRMMVATTSMNDEKPTNRISSGKWHMSHDDWNFIMRR